MPPLPASKSPQPCASAPIVHLERSGHYPYLDEPDAFWQAVAEFLETAA